MRIVDEVTEISEMFNDAIKHLEANDMILARGKFALLKTKIPKVKMRLALVADDLSSPLNKILDNLWERVQIGHVIIAFSDEFNAHIKKELIGGAERLLYIYLNNKAAFDFCEELSKIWLSKCLDDLLEDSKGYACYIIMHQFDIIPNARIGFDCYNLVSEIEFLRLCMKRYAENACVDEHYLLGEETIMYYYLGCSAIAFLQFDTKLDCLYDTLSPKEYYYYSLTSYLIDVDFEQVSTSAILNINSCDALSYYYKGHIYLLLGKRECAIDCFKKSVDFPYAKRMLDYLIYNIVDISSPQKVFLDPEHDELMYSKFEEYYHYHECLIAMKGYFMTPKIWYYFHGNTKHLEESLRITEANKLSKYLYSDLKGRARELTEDEYHMRISILNELLINRDSKARAAFFDIDKGIKEYACDAEHQIALTIQEFAFDNIDFYAIIIYYYYFNRLISEEAVINLSMYVMAVAKEKMKAEIYNTLFATSVSFVTAISILSPYCSISQFKQLCQSSVVKVTLQNIRGDKFFLNTTLYDNFINAIAIERLRIKHQLGERNFVVKYRFMSIIEKIHQLDSYLDSFTIETVCKHPHCQQEN